MLKDNLQNPLLLELINLHTNTDCQFAEDNEASFNGEILVAAHLRCIAAAVLTISMGNLVLTRRLGMEILSFLEEELQLGIGSTGNISQDAVRSGKVM